MGDCTTRRWMGEGGLEGGAVVENRGVEGRGEGEGEGR